MKGEKGDSWIYLNEITGTIDSSYITEGPNVYYPHNGGYPDDPMYEECATLYGGNLLTSSRIYVWDVDIEFKSGINSAVCLMPDFSQPIYQDRAYNWLYKVIQYYDTLRVHNITYKDVVNTQYINPKFGLNGGDYDTATITFFIAKNVGIIKFRKQYKQTDTTWSLVRWHSAN
jgi:hypothetical protein